MEAIVWCRCSYDTSSHLHGSWCATTREVGASLPPYDMNGDIARGQHGQHIASDTTQRSSLVVAPHDMEEETTQDGGGAREVEVVDADDATLDRLYGPVRLTWLERIARRWPVRLVQ